ncbi:MAG: inositol monophosphatase [Brachybacterium sp.]|nr:inositol monophosphatase [Brachybacterium sp.]
MTTRTDTSARTATPTPAELLAAAESAADRAVEYLHSIDRAAIDREYKTSHQDIVTEHDRRTEEIILDELHRLVPSARIVGEEGGEQAAQDGGGASSGGDPEDGAVFYVDPIDGTSNFAAGMPAFCVSIGAAIGQTLVAGVIDAPVLGQRFTAGPDGPALNGTPIAGRPTRAAQDAYVLAGLPTGRDLRERGEEALEDAARLVGGVSAVRHLGSAALELAYVAAGWADAAMLSKINAWDVAVGFLLVQQAGGSIRHWPGTGPADAPGHLQPAYVACSGPERIELLDEIQDRVQAFREASA